MTIRKVRRLAGLLAASSLLCAGPLRAQEFFAAQREFVLDKPCEAFTSLKRRTSPVPLEAGKSYVARGENTRDSASHAFIRVGGVMKWVDLSCGHYADAALPPPAYAPKGKGKGQAAGAQCLPFFDTDDNPVDVKFGGPADITPPPPVPDAFDTAVTEVCGPVGKVVSADEFKAMMRANPAVLSRLKAFTRDEVFAGRKRADVEEYLSDLAEAWFSIKAFDHIFCGEPGAGGGKIGGLHFHARYLQLQQSGAACRMNNLRQNEVVPGVIYTMGVILRTANGGLTRHATKGYGLTLSAEDILKTATRAFAENPTPSIESTGCLLDLADDGKRFKTVFVRRATGIRTFYPDATPSPRDPACAGAIDLQAAEKKAGP